ncbi:MAG TPA: hypothetical protein DD001_14790 [Microcoleaceae bacterium UBA10368]|nr:hypothetical protein [Microcoleaceae cyanobacterium UBA10368]HCV30470.1 hypothetical protein [Microcoleaceae cyanobacterium UBA9251]
MIIPPQFASATNFHYEEGLARVEINGKFGYIDKTGKIIIPLQLDDTYFFLKD